MKRFISFLIILIGDILALIASFFISYYIRISLLPFLFGMDLPAFFPASHFYQFSYLIVVFLLIFFYEKLYTRRFDLFEEFIFITRGLFIGVVFIVVIVYFSRSAEVFARTIFILMLFVGMAVVPLVRFLIKKILIVSGLYNKKTLVLGVRGEVNKVIMPLKKLEASGYQLAKIVQLDSPSNWQEDLGASAELAHQYETIIVVSHGFTRQQQDQVLNYLEHQVKEIKLLSDFNFLKTIGVETEYVDELLMIRMANNLLSPLNRIFKRIFDLVVSLVAIILLLPLFIFLWLVIKLESRGPIFFTQERFGQGGRKFKFIKFRSMYVNGDEKLAVFLKDNPQLQQEWDTYKKLKSYDPRVTKVGKFLRRFSLDELPQIIHVLMGDMSIVGPRPYLIREMEEIEKSAAIIFKVKSGLTGLWQIRGRSELSFQDRLKLDEFYVRNWSFLLDMLIILKTFGVVLRGKGAY